MSRRLFIAMLGFNLALFLMPQISLAEEDHIDEAIRHTKQAIVQGHAGIPIPSWTTPRKRSSKRGPLRTPMLIPTPKKRSLISIEQSLRANRDMVPRVRPRPK